MERIKSITETSWGIEVEIKPNIVFENIDVHKANDYVMNKLKESKKKKMLVHAPSLTRKLSLLSLLEGVKRTIQTAGQGLRIAIVAPNICEEEHTRFVETVGYNGGIQIKYFSDSEIAIKWLLN